MTKVNYKNMLFGFSTAFAMGIVFATFQAPLWASFICGGCIAFMFPIFEIKGDKNGSKS